MYLYLFICIYIYIYTYIYIYISINILAPRVPRPWGGSGFSVGPVSPDTGRKPTGYWFLPVFGSPKRQPEKHPKTPGLKSTTNLTNLAQGDKNERSEAIVDAF